MNHIMYLFEFSIYELLNLGSNAFLAFIPFRDYLRFSRRTTGLALGILFLMMEALSLRYFGNPQASSYLSVFFILLYLAFYKICVRAEVAKQLFVLLTILNYGSFVLIIFTHFAHHRLYPEDSLYSLRSVGVLALIWVVSYPVMIWMMSRKIRPLIAVPEYPATPETSTPKSIWRLLWLVPATTCLSYYFNLYSNGGIIPFSRDWNNVLFAALLNLGNLFITFLLAHLMGESYQSMRLKTENYQLSMQFIQYEHFKTRLDEAKRARHDFRQNLLIIQSYLNDRYYDKLHDYLRQYMRSLPADTGMIYCESFAMNALLIYYADLARQSGIEFHANTDYPENLPVAVTDAVTMIGNLLENAIEACGRQKTGRTFISLAIKLKGNALVIALDNSYCGVIHCENQHFISSKTTRNGIGISSVEKIAAKYQGITKFEYDKDVFHSSVLIYISKKEIL